MLSVVPGALRRPWAKVKKKRAARAIGKADLRFMEKKSFRIAVLFAKKRVIRKATSKGSTTSLVRMPNSDKISVDKNI